VSEAPAWVPPIQRTVATEGKGIAELAGHIARHAAHLRLSGDWAARERARLQSEMEIARQAALMNQFRTRVPAARYAEALQRVFERSLSPWEAVRMLLNGSEAVRREPAGEPARRAE